MGKPAGPKVIFHSDSALPSDTVEIQWRVKVKARNGNWSAAVHL